MILTLYNSVSLGDIRPLEVDSILMAKEKCPLVAAHILTAQCLLRKLRTGCRSFDGVHDNRQQLC